MSPPDAKLSVHYHWPSAVGGGAADEHRAAIVLRTGPAPTGPWSKGELVVSGEQYPQLYDGRTHAAPPATCTSGCRSGGRTTCG